MERKIPKKGVEEGRRKKKKDEDEEDASRRVALRGPPPPHPAKAGWVRRPWARSLQLFSSSLSLSPSPLPSLSIIERFSAEKEGDVSPRAEFLPPVSSPFSSAQHHFRRRENVSFFLFFSLSLFHGINTGVAQVMCVFFFIGCPWDFFNQGCISGDGSYPATTLALPPPPFFLSFPVCSQPTTLIWHCRPSSSVQSVWLF